MSTRLCPRSQYPCRPSLPQARQLLLQPQAHKQKREHTSASIRTMRTGVLAHAAAHLPADTILVPCFMKVACFISPAWQKTLFRSPVKGSIHTRLGKGTVSLHHTSTCATCTRTHMSCGTSSSDAPTPWFGVDLRCAHPVTWYLVDAATSPYQIAEAKPTKPETHPYWMHHCLWSISPISNMKHESKHGHERLPAPCPLCKNKTVTSHKSVSLMSRLADHHNPVNLQLFSLFKPCNLL